MNLQPPRLPPFVLSYNPSLRDMGKSFWTSRFISRGLILPLTGLSSTGRLTASSSRNPPFSWTASAGPSTSWPWLEDGSGKLSWSACRTLVGPVSLPIPRATPSKEVLNFVIQGLSNLRGADIFRAQLEAQMKRRGLPDSKSLLAALSSDTITRFGVRMLHDIRTGEWRLKDVGGTEVFSSKRECLLSYFRNYARQYGSRKSPYTLRRTGMGWWILTNSADIMVSSWMIRPNRKELANTLRKLRLIDSRPSWRRPDTLGWRTFGWHPTKHCLMSPVQKTLWTEPELRVTNWTEAGAVRGVAGIHACRLPRGDWRKAQRPDDMPFLPIIALVERFGKFVLGREGWRAEWVFIKEIMVPDEATARAARRVYPEIPICVAHDGHWCKSASGRYD